MAKNRSPFSEAANVARSYYRKAVKETKEGIKQLKAEYKKAQEKGKCDVSNLDNEDFVSKFGIIQRYAIVVSGKKEQKMKELETDWGEFCKIMNQLKGTNYNKERFEEKSEDAEKITDEIKKLKQTCENNEKAIEEIKQNVKEIKSKKTKKQKEDEKFIFGFFERGERYAAEINKQLEIYSVELGKLNSKTEELRKGIGNETRDPNLEYSNPRDKMIQVLHSGELKKIEDVGARVNNSLKETKSQNALFDKTVGKAKKLFLDAGIIKGSFIKNNLAHYEKNFERAKQACADYVENGGEINEIDKRVKKLNKWAEKTKNAIKEANNRDPGNLNFLALAKQLAFSAVQFQLQEKNIKDAESLENEFKVDESKIDEEVDELEVKPNEKEALKSFFRLAIIGNNKNVIVKNIQKMTEIVKETNSNLTEMIDIITGKTKDTQSSIESIIQAGLLITISLLTFPPNLATAFKSGIELYFVVKKIIVSIKKK
jgi:DNA repair exonuclease SbcCD ATPase subunit